MKDLRHLHLLAITACYFSLGHCRRLHNQCDFICWIFNLMVTYIVFFFFKKKKNIHIFCWTTFACSCNLFLYFNITLFSQGVGLQLVSGKGVVQWFLCNFFEIIFVYFRVGSVCNCVLPKALKTSAVSHDPSYQLYDSEKKRLRSAFSCLSSISMRQKQLSTSSLFLQSPLKGCLPPWELRRSNNGSLKERWEIAWGGVCYPWMFLIH